MAFFEGTQRDWSGAVELGNEVAGHTLKEVGFDNVLLELKGEILHSKWAQVAQSEEMRTGKRRTATPGKGAAVEVARGAPVDRHLPLLPACAQRIQQMPHRLQLMGEARMPPMNQ